MKTRTFSIFVLLILMTCNLNSNAQGIIYHDVDPDSTVSAATVGEHLTYQLDMDGNLATDITIGNWYLTGASKIIYATNSIFNEVLADAGNFPLALNEYDNIGPSSNFWYNPTNQAPLNQVNATSSVGNWKGVIDKYIGIRLKTSGDYLYGWIRLDIPTAPDSFTVKDYAYQYVPGVSIAAGDITGISENQLDRYLISVWSGTIRIKLNGPGDGQGIVNIVSLTGRTVYSGTLNAGSTTISGLNLNKGIYLLHLYFNNKSHTAKIRYQY